MTTETGFSPIAGSWFSSRGSLAETYQHAEGFPYIVIDDFLSPDMVQNALAAFPAVDQGDWINYLHFNEKKFGLNKWEYIPPVLKEVIERLNSPEFVAYLSELTGIKGLMADPDLEGGGLHQIRKDGFLNIHADFTVHPHHRKWKRRVNVLLYLNPGWEESYGGHLELWTRDMKSCFKRVLPVLNRCVVFNTDHDSYHGHPHPLTCPENVTRKSIALYYFTEEDEAPVKRITNYQSLPGDSWGRAMMIYLDKKMIAAYSRTKSALGINDDMITRFLNFITRKK